MAMATEKVLKMVIKADANAASCFMAWQVKAPKNWCSIGESRDDSESSNRLASSAKCHSGR